ncbi:hypothetical protein BDY24DRAFT_395786 [Mrakia frigida]|uniref:zinc finger MYND domain-containing protein n=1 Tax=Mrakia frigida TaxID=29902 RepID=UPI003FCC18EA
MYKPVSYLTADDIASILGLKDGSYRGLIGEGHQLKLLKGLKVNDPSFPPQLLPAVLTKHRIAQMVSELEKDGSLALPEFTHLYLPELIQAHSLASASEFDNFWTRTLVLVAVVGNAYFDRYARKPVEGSNLLECLLKSLAENFPSHPELLDPNSSHDGRDPRVVCTGWLHIITSIILSRSSRTPPQGISSPSSRLLLPSLQVLVSDLQLPRTKVVLPSWYLEDATTLLRRALLLIGLLKGDLDPPLFFESLQFVSWWRCEGTTTAGGVLENCRDIRDGEEVVACGRCRSVRYCSIAHQRAHWKEHRETCWEPIW